MIHLCSLRLTRLPSTSSLPRGRAASRIFYIHTHDFTDSYCRYLLYAPFIPGNRCYRCLAGDILLTGVPAAPSPVFGIKARIYGYLSCRPNEQRLLLFVIHLPSYLRWRLQRQLPLRGALCAGYWVTISTLLGNHVIDRFVLVIVRI